MDKSFFQSLYSFCDIGKIEARALPSRKQQFFELEDISGIENFCRTNKPDNLYFGVALRKDDSSGGKDNISQMPAVWCDVDYKETPREVFIDRFKAFPFKPSIIVKSGGGIHYYWILKEPLNLLKSRCLKISTSG